MNFKEKLLRVFNGVEYYTMYEDVCYHEIINETTNTYSIFREIDRGFLGVSKTLIMSNINNIDDAQEKLSKYKKMRRQYLEQGSRKIVQI